MKNLKFYQIIAAIACATCSINIQAMDAETIRSALSRTATAISEIACDAAKGISNRALGYANPLMNEIDQLNIDPVQTNRDHRYERAIDELVSAKDSQRLFDLIEKVNKHNAAHVNLAFHMSPLHQSMIQQPLQDLYAKKRRELIADAARQAHSLMAQWELDYEVLVQTMGEQEATIRNMSGIIAAAGGQKPDDQWVMTELERLLAINRQYTFAATLTRLVELESKKRASTTTLASALASSSVPSSSPASTPTTTTAQALLATASSSSSSSSKQAQDPSTTTVTQTTAAASSSRSSSTNICTTPSPAYTAVSSSSTSSSSSNPSPLNLVDPADGDEDEDDVDDDEQEVAAITASRTATSILPAAIVISAHADKKESDTPTAAKKKKKKKKKTGTKQDDDGDDD